MAAHKDPASPTPPPGYKFCARCVGKRHEAGTLNSAPPPALAVTQGIVQMQIGPAMCVLVMDMCLDCVTEGNGPSSIVPAAPGLNVGRGPVLLGQRRG